MSIKTVLCTYTLAKYEYRTVQRCELILNYWSAVATFYKLYALQNQFFVQQCKQLFTEIIKSAFSSTINVFLSYKLIKDFLIKFIFFHFP